MRSRQSEPRRSGDQARRKSFRASVERLETKRLLAAFVVTNTNDSGPGSLRQAITAANTNPGADNIDFGIPASTASPRTPAPPSRPR